MNMGILRGLAVVIAIFLFPYVGVGGARTFVTSKGTFTNAAIESTTMNLKDWGEFNITVQLPNQMKKVVATVTWDQLSKQDQNIFLPRLMRIHYENVQAMVIKVSEWGIKIAIIKWNRNEIRFVKIEDVPFHIKRELGYL